MSLYVCVVCVCVCGVCVFYGACACFSFCLPTVNMVHIRQSFVEIIAKFSEKGTELVLYLSSISLLSLSSQFSLQDSFRILNRSKLCSLMIAVQVISNGNFFITVFGYWN